MLIFLFSFKYGFGRATLWDGIFLSVALLAFIPWAITRDPTLSVVIAVGIDLVSFIPTFRKTWSYPKTESSGLYAANVARHVLALASLQTYNIATTLHSIAMILSNTAMVATINRKLRAQ